MLVDLGTGDGRAVLTTAAAHRDRLVIGIDPVAASLAESSRRAAAPTRKGGLPNALFVVASAESLPPDLRNAAERVTITLPWGSLLRGALALDPAAARGIAALVRPGGDAELLLAPTARDNLAADISVDARLADGLAADWHDFGLELTDARPATDAELGATRTTWAKRLGLADAGADRRAWRLVLRRGGEGSPDLTSA